MNLPRWAGFLLIVPALFFGLFFLVALFLALSILPPVVSTICVGIMAVLLCWFFFLRRGKNPVASEGSLMGRQSSKDGLL